MTPDVIIRTAAEGDRDAILRCVRDAFSIEGSDGQEEVDIVVATWSLGASVDDLELVAVDDGAIVGHVLASPGDLNGRTVLGVAPLSVKPTYQDRGIGSALVDHLLRQADEDGLPLVVLLGDPTFYGRFGFEPSGPLNIFYRPVGAGDPHFQARRLAVYDPSYQGEFKYCWEVQAD